VASGDGSVVVVVVMKPHLVSSTVSSPENGSCRYSSMITPQYTVG
jgi:hypothetical protein